MACTVVFKAGVEGRRVVDHGGPHGVDGLVHFGTAGDLVPNGHLLGGEHEGPQQLRGGVGTLMSWLPFGKGHQEAHQTILQLHLGQETFFEGVYIFSFLSEVGIKAQ